MRILAASPVRAEICGILRGETGVPLTQHPDLFAALAAPFATEENPRWAEIPDHQGYRVSDTGRVQSDLVRGTRTGQRTGVWKDLKLSPGKKGYIRVKLGGRLYSVHSLVLEVFDGPSPDGHECLHGDGNPANNFLWNLRWGTRSENIGDAMLHDTIPRGQGHWNCKVPDSVVAEIRSLHADGTGVVAIARKFGLRHQHVSRLVKNRQRKPNEV